MGEIYFIYLMSFSIVIFICSIMVFNYILVHYHPIWVEIKQIFEQANINNNGELTDSQFQFISNMAEQNIVMNSQIYIIFWSISIGYLIFYCKAPAIVFKFISYLFIPVIIFFSFLAWNNNVEYKHQSILTYFKSEDYYLKAKKMEKNNEKLNQESHSVKGGVSEQDLKRFFEDQKI